MKKWFTFAFGAVCVSSLAFAGCSAHDDDLGTEEDNIESSSDADSIASTSTYFIATRRDMRRCAAPTCGGVFVKRVNQMLTRCVDGSWARECYVFQADFTGAGFSDEESSELNNLFGSKQLLIRGSFRSDSMGGRPAVKLVATEAWKARAGQEPTGIFYKTEDNGIRCITYPCNSIHEAKLNSRTSRNLAGVDLSQTGAADSILEEAGNALANGGLLVAGHHGRVSGPAGRGTTLIASEFYTRAVPAPVNGGQECGGFRGLQCPAGQYCDITIANACNGADLPGKCITRPEICTKIYMPVCGCDGNTYGNDCMRQGALVQLDHEGSCAN